MTLYDGCYGKYHITVSVDCFDQVIIHQENPHRADAEVDTLILVGPLAEAIKQYFKEQACAVA